MKRDQSQIDNPKNLCEKLVSLKEYGAADPLVSNVDLIRVSITVFTEIRIKP